MKKCKCGVMFDNKYKYCNVCRAKARKRTKRYTEVGAFRFIDRGFFEYRWKHFDTIGDILKRRNIPFLDNYD